MFMTHYAVTATCPSGEVAARYISWLVDEGHLEAVRRAGAVSALAVRLDPPPNAPCKSVRVLSIYHFADRNAFHAYEKDHAPRLRAEGVARFDGAGITFERSTGEIVYESR